MMKPHVFRSEQYVPRPLPEVFDFFSRAENLQELTPPWLHFRILAVEPAPVQKGTRIRYALRWRIFPIRWTSEITEWEPPVRFADVQRQGPYSLWHHTHRFVAEGDGTRIYDEVQYLLPLGIVGRLAHALKVKRDIERIFAYRQEAITKRFGSVAGHGPDAGLMQPC